MTRESIRVEREEHSLGVVAHPLLVLARLLVLLLLSWKLEKAHYPRKARGALWRWQRERENALVRTPASYTSLEVGGIIEGDPCMWDTLHN